MKTLLLSLFALLFTTAGTNCWSELPIARPGGNEQQCFALAARCFQVSDSSQTTCFYSTATHPDCEGTNVGRLVHKRWALSPETVENEESDVSEAAGFVDQRCVANCDNKFAAELLLQNLTGQTVKTLNGCYDACRRLELPDLPRP